MPLQQIISLLRQTIGLDVDSVGHRLVERVVKQRLASKEIGDFSHYADLLQRSETELQTLVEGIVIPETFFFRYPESFVALRKIVAEKFLWGNQLLRILSVPCSTGEEPYSIAMALFEAGLPPERFQIDAVDISSHLLDLAKAGFFGSNSFRGSDFLFRNQYFKKVGNGFQLSDRVREKVKFKQGNVLQEGSQDGPYDFIFCRNLLIYFGSEAEGQALRGLKRLLTAEGLLFVGSAETSLLAQYGFSSMKLPMAFAFRKSDAAASQAAPRAQALPLWLPVKGAREKLSGGPLPATAARVMPDPKKAEKRIIADLALAEQLADEGDLGKAAEICEVSLREQGPSARAFHLLGLIREGAGDQGQASEFYRRALYLEPEHYGALVHLALIKDRNGESTAAKALKNRARRVVERTK